MRGGEACVLFVAILIVLVIGAYVIFIIEHIPTTIIVLSIFIGAFSIIGFLSILNIILDKKSKLGDKRYGIIVLFYLASMVVVFILMKLFTWMTNAIILFMFTPLVIIAVILLFVFLHLLTKNI